MTTEALFDLTSPQTADRSGSSPATDGGCSVPAGPVRTTPPRVVGVDTSLTATGIASSLGWCHTIGRDKVSTLPLYRRMDTIDELVEQIICHIGRPDLVVIENPLFRAGTGAAFDRYTLWLQVVRKLRGREIPIAFANLQHRMKYATGAGGAKKGAVVDAVARRLPMFATSGDDNMADAAILCAMGADHLGFPLVTMPASHRTALDTVEWPDIPKDSTC